jgi:hypothetical protein
MACVLVLNHVMVFSELRCGSAEMDSLRQDKLDRDALDDVSHDSLLVCVLVMILVSEGFRLSAHREPADKSRRRRRQSLSLRPHRNQTKLTRRRAGLLDGWIWIDFPGDF